MYINNWVVAQINKTQVLCVNVCSEHDNRSGSTTNKVCIGFEECVCTLFIFLQVLPDYNSKKSPQDLPSSSFSFLGTAAQMCCFRDKWAHLCHSAAPVCDVMVSWGPKLNTKGPVVTKSFKIKSSFGYIRVSLTELL